MTILRATLFMLALMIGNIALAGVPKEDPVLFFDSKKYWGKIDLGYFIYNIEKGEVTYEANKKSNQGGVTYTYNVDTKTFGEIYKGTQYLSKNIVNLEPIHLYYNQEAFDQKTDEFGVKIVYTGAERLRYYAERETKYPRNPEYPLVNLDGLWIALVLDREQYTNVVKFFNNEVEYDFHSEYLGDADVKISPKGDLYISAGSSSFFYKIPVHMRGTIIVRERMVYAPIQYLLHVWEKIPECKNRVIYEEYRFYRQYGCLVSFFTNLTKGDYDADSFELITPR